MNSLDFNKPCEETRVVVAMSGGVDSSTVAALLKVEGYEVIGITLQLYDDGVVGGRKGACCAGRDIGDARTVAAKLGFPHYVLDFEARFRRAVIDPFAASYAAGETPVPCAACNNAVKFTDLMAMARALGADALATGHYCATRLLPSGRRGLFRAADSTRDQSYFLAGTTAEQLQFIRFPLGDVPKSRVREMARSHGLVNADKPDSQDICFVPTGHYSDLVVRMMPEAFRPGDIVDLEGRELGRHDGVINYTVGQRKGLSLGGGIQPLFVVRIDAPNARIVVGPRTALSTTRVDLRDVNWLGDGSIDRVPAAGLEVHVRTRSTQAPVPARLIWDGAAAVEFPAPERAVSPGQICVFYDSGEERARVLGGGTVARNSDTARATPASRELADAQ